MRKTQAIVGDFRPGWYEDHAGNTEYVLSTFNGIHDETALLSDNRSTAQRLLATYDQLAAM